MPADEGSQIVTVKFHDPVDSHIVNERHRVVRDVGIYSGGRITIQSGPAGTVSLSPLVCEIRDAVYQVRAETTVAVNKTLAVLTPYLILRWTYAGSATLDYMSILAVTTPATYDVVVGKGSFTGSTLVSIIYNERTGPEYQRYFLKAQPTDTPSTSIRVRKGVALTGSGMQAISDQILDLSGYTAGNVVYVYITDGGALSHSATSTVYRGFPLIAVVTIPAGGIIIASSIVDARSFLTSPAIPDGVTIGRTSTGKLEVIESGLALTMANLTHYDSGWFPVVANTDYSKAHGLGRLPVFVAGYYGDTANGSGVVHSLQYFVRDGNWTGGIQLTGFDVTNVEVHFNQVSSEGTWAVSKSTGWAKLLAF